MELTVNQIAEAVKGTVHGDGSIVIRGAAGLAEATGTDISYLRDAKNAEQFSKTQAAAVFVPGGSATNGNKRTVVEVDNPVAAFSWILERLAEEQRPAGPKGVHKLASVDKSATVSKNAVIGPFCVVEKGAVIEDGVELVAQIFVGARSRIGKGTRIFPQVVIREDITVGERCIIHAGSIIGSDGYGFYFAGGKHNKIPQVGTVIIEDDVEIGSCTTIDRATTGVTIIRRGTKIDNLVQVAHNVEVGEHSLLVAQTGIAGSAKLGRGVIIAGQAGVGDHLTIGDGCMVGGQAGVQENLPAGMAVWGTPAQPVKDAIRQSALSRRLPEIFKDVKALKEKIKDE